MLLILTLQFYHLLEGFGVQPAADNDPYKRVSGWRECLCTSVDHERINPAGREQQSFTVGEF